MSRQSTATPYGITPKAMKDAGIAVASSVGGTSRITVVGSAGTSASPARVSTRP